MLAAQPPQLTTKPQRPREAKTLTKKDAIMGRVHAKHGR